MDFGGSINEDDITEWQVSKSYTCGINRSC